MHEIAYGGFTDTVTEFALIVDSWGEENPLPNREIETHVSIAPGWCHMKLLPSGRVLCTLYNHAPCHFMQSHIRKMHACLAVTFHLHFWQTDRDLLRATAVTQGE